MSPQMVAVEEVIHGELLAAFDPATLVDPMEETIVRVDIYFL